MSPWASDGTRPAASHSRPPMQRRGEHDARQPLADGGVERQAEVARACAGAARRAAPGAERNAGGDAVGAEEMAEQDRERDRDHEALERSRAAASACPRGQKRPATAPWSAHGPAGASASQISACAVAALSSAANAPCSNSSRTIGSRQHDQSERRRQRQPDRQFEPARFRMRDRVTVAAAQRARQLRHQHRAHGDADDAERQLDQAVGEIEPRDRRGRGEAMMAPATTSNCGPALATMPGIALPKKPRISGSKDTRSGVARRALRCAAAASRAAAGPRCRRWPRAPARRRSRRRATAAARR